MLIMPIIVLFYNENGMSMKDILLLQSIYSISIVAFEIPSGYLADIWGRRNTIILGSILGFLGYLIYCFTHGMWGFLFAEIILGIGQSFISGADSALLYDTLLAKSKEKEYIKYEGKLTAFGNFAESIGAIIGGFLAIYSLRMPFYYQTGLYFIAIPFSFMLIEPIKMKTVTEKYRYIVDIIQFSLIKNRLLKWNIIYSSIIGCSTLTMAWFVQPYFKEVEVDISLYGILWTVLNISVAITSFYIFSIKKLIGEKKLLISISIILSLCYIISGITISYFGIFVIWIFYIFRGIATPLLKDSINVISPSEMRATILSIRNFIIRILFAILGPMLGYLNDITSLSITLIISGILFILISGFSVFKVLKYRKLN